MTPSDHQALRASLIAHEGIRHTAYFDTVGKVTIGCGRNLTDVGLTDEEIDLLLEHDIADAVQAVSAALPWFDRLDGPRQRVLAEMTFNLGIDGLLGFHRTLEEIRTGHYELAAADMLQSKWARQVGARATRLAALVRTGAVNV